MVSTRPSSPRVHLFLSRLLACLLFAAVFFWVRPVAAQTVCDRAGCGTVRNSNGTQIICFTPATAPPASLWSSAQLQPAYTGALPSERDSTDFNEFTQPYNSRNWFQGLEIQNGYVLVALAHGIGVWDTHADPANPVMLAAIRYQSSATGQFPFLPVGELSKIVFGGIAAPDDSVAAIAGYSGAGVLVFDLTDKSHPRPVYQNAGKNSDSIYAAKIVGTRYAFLAAGGLYVYNLDNALTAGGCLETDGVNPGNCPGVLVKQVATTSPAGYFLHGVDNFVGVSLSLGGFQVFDMSNPLNPVSKLIGAQDRPVQGIAMWKQGTSYYLAARLGKSASVRLAQTAIYDVSCVATANGCSGLGAPLSLLNLDSVSATEYLTFSRSSVTPFLYVGGDAYCNGADGQQREWLLDVTDPTQPKDITPTATTSVSALYNGVSTPVSIDYWSYFYRGSPTGFNLMSPRSGKFSGDYFYRMGRSIMDVHKWIHNVAPTADFSYSPTEIYASSATTQGTPVTFTDRSAGVPTSWSWSFQDGSPGTSTAQSLSGVVFSSAGTKSVSLTASNAQGSNATTPPRSVVVLPPAPQIGGLTVSPPSPLVCQPVTVTATGVTGLPTLTYSWAVKDSGSNPVPASSSTGTLNWSTTGLAAGAYTATVTVSNGAGTASKPVTINLGALPALTDISGAAPTVAINNNSVKLTVPTSQGATAWTWDFGDGTTQTITDPVQGPSPTHVYASIGQYSATVKISNCVPSAGSFTSQPVTVNVIQTTPLKAAFQAQLVTCIGSICSASTGQQIFFTDSSTGADFWDYDWEHASSSAATCSFTDAGHTAPVTTPHVYNTPGDYYPCLRVRRGASEQDVAVHADLKISTGNGGGGGGGGGGTPAITIVGPGSGNVSTPYTFAATASNCTPVSGAWTWSAGGGTISGATNGSSVTITWASAGAKTVTASNSGCSNFGTLNVTISDGNGGGGGGGGGALAALFSFSPPSPNPGDAVSFDGGASTGSPTGYSWDFGDGSGTVTGKTATHSFAAAGSYAVKLTVSAPGTGCPFAPCLVSASTTKTVVVNGTPPPSADFTTSVSCTNIGGFDQCQAATGQTVTFTATATDVTSYRWDFSNGGTATTASTTHAFSPAGIYLVTLTVTKGSATASKNVRIIAAGPSASKSVVLPWVAQTRGALVQTSDLYIHNPSANPMSVTLAFRKRGLPDTNPPQASKTIAPGATLYVPDVLGGLFNRENVAGFISLTVDQGDTAPVITSYNTTFQADGKQFGQTISGISMSSLSAAAKDGSAGPTKNLVGLINNSDRLAYFGISNPSETAVTYHLRLYDKVGKLIGETNPDLTVAPFGQRQFQSAEIESTFGVVNQDDYRVEVQPTAGGDMLVPYASNLRLASQDPSFIEAGSSSNAKSYLLGALSAPGANGTLWQTDLLLSNVNTQPVSVDVIFTGIGVNAVPTSPAHVTLQPGETQRLQNVIAGQWHISNAIGLLTVKSTSPNGIFPIAQAESYDNANPAKRFGQSMAALTDADAAGAGQGQYLAGLRQDANHRTTLWLYNPGTANGVYDLVYRNLDGTVITTTANVQLAGGKLRQFTPAQLPLPAGGVQNGFTVQIVVKSGRVLSAAQVVNNDTNDPSYIQGDVR
ncbi:MAG TPA: PKD domain-containing protein [Thermoanaerobaculia bacterium]